MKLEVSKTDRVICPMTGKAVYVHSKCHQSGRAVRQSCEHAGYYANDKVYVCRYTEKRDLRVKQEVSGIYESTGEIIPT